MNVQLCPEKSLWQRYALGLVEESQQQELDLHLHQCQACLEMLADVRGEDDLMQTLRRGIALPQEAPAEEIERLSWLACGIAEIENTTLIQSARGEGVTPEEGISYRDQAPDAVLALLAPPRQAGELGRLGSFRVLRLLGQGGMGVVFLAEDIHLHRQLALKVLRPERAGLVEARTRFLAEARAMAALKHDHIAVVHQAGVVDGVVFLAMELLAGQSLQTRLQNGPLPVSEVLRIGREAALGLAEAHTRGLIHRDIKPANLWLEAPSGRLKILDFGLVLDTGADTHLTQTGTVVGTPSYMAPEQIDHRGVGPSCDLFSLGVVLYSACTGQLPFAGNSPLAVLRAMAVESPRPIQDLAPSVPDALATLIEQMLARDPAGRPVSAQEVADQLWIIETLVATPTSQIAKPNRGSRGGIWKSRGRIGAAAVLLLAILGPLGWLCGPTVYRYATNKGDLVVRVEDDNVQLTVTQNGVIVSDRTTKREFTLTAGDGQIDVYEKSSGLKLATKQFTLTRGATVRVTVELPARSTVKLSPAETSRQTAEWVLSLGGSVVVRVAGEERHVTSAKSLPPGAFQLVLISLSGNQRVVDADLARLEGLPDLNGVGLQGTRVGNAGTALLRKLAKLKYLYLGNTRIDDAGVAHLADLKNLVELDLGGTPIRNAGLTPLKGLAQLLVLNLRETAINDDGVAHLASLKKLHELNLSGTRVSDAGLAHLKEMPHLDALFLNDTSVSDAGLARLTGFTQLRKLRLAGTRISDAGLKHLAELGKLQEVRLDRTRVSDAGVEHLRKMSKLRVITLAAARVSAKGIASLKAAFPSTRLLWWEPNRTAAEMILAEGGKVHLRGKGDAGERLVKDVKDLPDDYFQVTRADLAGVRGGVGRALKRMALLSDPDFDRLGTIDLSGTIVSDDDLKQLRKLTRLQALVLARTGVTDTALMYLAALKGLTQLDLSGTKTTAEAIAELKKALPKCQIHSTPKSK
jgi:serine/threonine protein kinase